MALVESLISPPAHAPAVAELVAAAVEGRLVVVPDTVDELDGRRVAGYRRGTQELRVAAAEVGVYVTVATPEGAVAGAYAEHAADWVLPLVLSVPVNVVSNLVYDLLKDWLGRRAEGERIPTARFRELIVEGDKVIQRELEGPADEIMQWLCDRELPGAALPELAGAEQPAPAGAEQADVAGLPSGDEVEG